MVGDLDERLGAGEPVRSALSDLFVDGVPVDGASISVVGLTGTHSVIASTGTAAAVLERMQFGLGEGPHWDALAAGEPVLLGDTTFESVRRWPVFAGELASLAIGAIFSFPMKLGAAVVGVVDLCRDLPGDLSGSELQEALSLTRTVTRTAVHVATAAAAMDPDAGLHTDESVIGAFPEMRREVHQATGMLAVQLGATATTTDAFATMRAFAFAQDRPLEDIASDIVNRRLDFAGSTP